MNTCLLLCAALLAAVVAAAPSAAAGRGASTTKLQSHNPLAELERLRQVKKVATAIRGSFKNAKLAAPSARGQRFNPQETDPICTTPEAGTVQIEAFSVCASAADLFSFEPSSIEEANSVIGGFCTGECGVFLNNIDPQYIQCFPADAQEFFRYSRFMCREENGALCGAAVFAVGALACEGTDAATCGGPGCAWNAGTRSCDIVVSNTLLDSLCSPCLGIFISTFPSGSLLGPEARNGIQVILSTVCSRAGDQWCYPKVQNLINSEGDEFTTSELDTICADAATFTCLRRITQVGLLSMKPFMDATFVACANATCASEVNCIETVCKPGYSDFIAGLEGVEFALGSLCVKNTAGAYCFAEDAEEEETSECTFMPFAGMCPEECDAVVRGVVDAAGCCLGIVQQTLFAQPRRLADNEFPPHNRVGTLTPAPTSVQPPPTPDPLPPAGEVVPGPGEELVPRPVPGGLEAFGLCPSVAPIIRQRLAVQCAPERAAPVRRAMRVRVPYAAIATNEELRAALTESMARDTATALGLTTREIQNRRLEEDLSLQLAAPTAASAPARAMRTAATQSGTRFSFEILASDASVASLAASEFDRQLQDGTIALPSTTSTLSVSCTTCDLSAGLTAGAATPPDAAAPLAAVVAMMALLLSALLL